MKHFVEVKRIGGSFAGLSHPYKWIIAVDGRHMLKRHDTKAEAKAYGQTFLARLNKMGVQ